jgi:hypothetical protein
MCLFNFSEQAILSKQKLSPPWNTYIAGSSPWKINLILTGNNVLDPPSLTQMVVFGAIHVFLQLTWIGLFGRKRAILHLENYDLQDVFLTKISSVLMGKQCSTCSSSNTDCFLWSDKYVSSSQQLDLFVTKWVILHLENYDWRKYSFQKLTQFSLDYNALDTPASNRDGFV